MTDDSTIDPAERIARLQARRAASGRPPRAAPARTGDDTPTTAPVATSRAPGRTAPAARPGRRRRSHPAAATRWLLGGLSIASFFGIAGTVAAANVANTTSAAAPVAATAPAASTPTAATPVAASATSATHATKVAPVVHTTTRGS